MKPLNVGILGAGGIAHKLHLPELQAVAGVQVTCLAGRKEHRLRRLAERFGVPRWTQDYHALLSDPSIDAVCIATPHPQHVPMGIEALAAGKHVLMQKPLCANLAEADAFVEAAERSGRTVFCLPHFGPHVFALRDLVREGAIGRVSGGHARVSHGGPEVYYAEVRDAFGEEGGDLWFFDARRASVGALFDMGVYAVSLLVAVLGSAVRVCGLVRTVAKPTDLEDTATLILEMEGGGLATAETGWCDPARTFEFRAHGTAGKLTMPGTQGAGATRWNPGSSTREDVPPTPLAVDAAGYPAVTAHQHFIDCIRREVQPLLSNARTARHVTEILLAGLASSKDDRSVPVRSRLG
ncbi:MAG: Gfo/Idh/MocA family oxidoreductase [Planctomycetes bacterium]|nr:Gfo/Idh/MocA family oxidoreductase [Planctomycetota bacterium]